MGLVGMNADDVRRAKLDEHAELRFPKLLRAERDEAAARMRALFDIEALLTTLKNEINSFSETSPEGSLPRRFLDWAAARLQEKHIVFDEDTCSKVDVEDVFVLAIVEQLFGGANASADETYRGCKVFDLFLPEEFARKPARRQTSLPAPAFVQPRAALMHAIYQEWDSQKRSVTDLVVFGSTLRLHEKSSQLVANSPFGRSRRLSQTAERLIANDNDPSWYRSRISTPKKAWA